MSARDVRQRHARSVLLTAAWLAVAATMGRSEASDPRPIAITDVSVIDGTGRPVQHHLTLLIVDGRIARIASRDRADIPPRAQIVAGTGKYVIPGLWDMHVHLGSREEGEGRLRRLLRSGVTAVRDMGSPVDDILRLRTEGIDGSGAPRSLFVAGPILQGSLPFSVPAMIRAVGDVDAARRTVRELHAKGVDFIKVGDTLPRDIYRAIVADATHLHLPVAGHVPVAVGAREASAAGQRSIEHLGSAAFHAVLIACSRGEQELTAYARDVLDGAMRRAESADAKLSRAAFVSRLVDDYDERKAARLFAQFVKNDTWQVPTLTALHSVLEAKRSELSPEDRAAAERLWQQQLAVVGAMARARVPLLAGTDVPIGEGAAPLHDELALLVQAGLSPMQALQAATRDAAAFVGRSREIGTIESNRIANVVMLDGDPLADITNTRRVSVVIVNGRIITPN